MVSGRSPFKFVFAQIFRHGTDKEIVVFQFSERRRGEWLLEPGRVYGTLDLFKRNGAFILHVMEGAGGWITWLQGGGQRYPYPKYVWSPAGGWWVRPSNWATNTAVAAMGIFAITFGVWKVSAKYEQRVVQPDRPIPSMLWAKEYTEKKKEH